MGSEYLIAAKAAVDRQFARVPLGEAKVSGPTMPAVRTLLGKDVDIAATSSPKFIRMLIELQMSGWVMQYGARGAGTYCHRSQRKIVLDPEKLTKVDQILSALAYEASYAILGTEPYIQPKGLAKDEFVVANVAVKIRSEAHRILNVLEIADDLETNQGLTIRLPDVPMTDYSVIAERFPREQDRPKALEAIGAILADRRPEGASVTFRERYSKSFADYYESLPPEEDSLMEQ
jgi:hypothetical protein